jgi:pimeloyl-ACP methyl ester carboxylesterase
MRSIRYVLLAGSLILTAVAGAVLLHYENEMGDARDSASHGSLVANTDAGPIEYAEAGSGFPPLSIHGAGGGFDQGLANAAELVGQGFRLIAPSRFGYLRTEVPEDSTPAARADAHAALLSKLTIPRSVVVGVSAGARSAVELAIRRASLGRARTGGSHDHSRFPRGGARHCDGLEMIPQQSSKPTLSRHYSYRSASIGSRRAALRAG